MERIGKISLLNQNKGRKYVEHENKEIDMLKDDDSLVVEIQW